MVTLAYVLLRKHALLHATGQFNPNHGMMDMARTLPLVMSIYLRQLLVPMGITGLYYTPYVTGAILTQVVAPALVLGAALIGLWYWNRREGNSIVAFAGLWLLVGSRPRCICEILAMAILCATVTCICRRSDLRFWRQSGCGDCRP